MTKRNKVEADDTLAEAPESDDISKVFLSEFNAKFNPLENQLIVSAIDNIMVESRTDLSRLLGKKVHFDFSKIHYLTSEEISAESDDLVISNFLILPQNKQGYIFFKHTFLSSVIESLYGAGTNQRNQASTTLGKVGIIIARKITDICLSALQKSIGAESAFEISLLKTSDQAKLIINHSTQDKFYSLSFQTSFDDVLGQINIAIPEKIIKGIALENKDSQLIEETLQTPILSQTLKNEIIESSVTLVASLPEIKLKFKEILELKSGDLIPIGDPTLAYLVLSQKKIFKVTIGQSNSLRVVKMIESI